MPIKESYPGAYIEEVSDKQHTIEGVPTSIAAFVGRAISGPVASDAEGAVSIESFAEYVNIFGGLSHDAPMSYAVQNFFLNGGTQAVIARLVSPQGGALNTDDYLRAFENGALENADIFNLLCIPPDNVNVPSDIPPAVWAVAAAYCVRRRAMLILDSPVAWTTSAGQGNFGTAYQDITQFELNADQERNAAVYFPRVVQSDPLTGGETAVFPPCGIIAGIIATTDIERGVWKAPAGINAGLSGVVSLELTLSDAQNGILNPLGINCLRSFPVYGPVVWGARTLRGADQFEDDYKYINVRRLSLYIEESIDRGTKWAAFEPNDEQLWSALRASTNTFMEDLQRNGAFYSYFVNCDKTTTTESDIAEGIVNIIIGFAPVQPAEFVVIQIQQMAGQSS